MGVDKAAVSSWKLHNRGGDAYVKQPIALASPGDSVMNTPQNILRILPDFSSLPYPDDSSLDRRLFNPDLFAAPIDEDDEEDDEDELEEEEEEDEDDYEDDEDEEEDDDGVIIEDDDEEEEDEDDDEDEEEDEYDDDAEDDAEDSGSSRKIMTVSNPPQLQHSPAAHRR